MNDTTDYDAIRRDLALLCCRLRGLNPDHPVSGGDPLWKTPLIMDTVDVMMTMAGSDAAARPHIELAASR
jgi:hypothetical protein